MTVVDAQPFSKRFTVSSNDLDQNGHVNGAVYVQWGDDVRTACSTAAGVSMDDLVSSGVGPVNLETNIKYHRELRLGQNVEVTCRFEWGDRKTMRIVQHFLLEDGSLAAELTSTGGLLDLKKRRLVENPSEHWRSAATSPEILGL
jgi:acyl-CoA thioester hydrolase